jgi:hypothetical protein
MHFLPERQRRAQEIPDDGSSRETNNSLRGTKGSRTFFRDRGTKRVTVSSENCRIKMR